MAEYRKKNRFTVKTTDGQEWVIRKIPMDPLFLILEKLGVSFKEPSVEAIEKELAETMKREESKKMLPDLIKLAVPACTVKPKIVLGEPTTDDEINYDDVDPVALIELFEMAMERTGVSEQESKRRQSFRDKPDGSTGVQPGSEPQQTT